MARKHQPIDALLTDALLTQLAKWAKRILRQLRKKGW
jgi:hypothetical protein